MESQEHPIIRKLREHQHFKSMDEETADQYIMEFLLNEWGIYRRAKLKVSELLFKINPK